MFLSQGRVKPATGLCLPQLRHVVCVFCCVTFYMAALHYTLLSNNVGEVGQKCGSMKRVTIEYQRSFFGCWF